MKIDPIRYLVNQIIAAACRSGGLSEGIAFQIERAFRQEYAGDVIYVRVKIEPRAEHEIVKRRYLANETVINICSDMGISRATFYRLLRR